MLMFRRKLLLDFLLRTGLNTRTCIRFFLSAFLPVSVTILLFFSLFCIFFVSICTHFLMCLFISLFFTAIYMFVPCYFFPRLLSLSAHTSVTGSAGFVFLLSMYVSESVMFSTP